MHNAHKVHWVTRQKILFDVQEVVIVNFNSLSVLRFHTRMKKPALNGET